MEDFCMKLLIYLIIGGLSALLFSLIAQNFSAPTALIILEILVVIAIIYIFIKRKKLKKNN